MDDEKLEERILALRLKAPRIKLSDIEDRIVKVSYTKLPSGKCCICEMTLKNGFVVIGEASCVSAANYNDEIAREVSYSKAKGKIWELEGYLLQEDCFVTAMAQQCGS